MKYDINYLPTNSQAWSFYDLLDSSFVSNGVCSDSSVFALLEGKNGLIWIKTKNEIVTYDGNSGNWEHKWSGLGWIASFSIIEKAPNGDIWIIEDGVIQYYDSMGWHIPAWANMINMAYRDLEFDRNGDLWFSTSRNNFGNAGLFKVEDGHLFEWNLFNSPINTGEIFFEFDGNGQIWVTAEGSLLQINPERLVSFSTEELEICLNQPILFTNHTTIADSFQWIIENTIVSREEGLTHSFDSVATYEVKLIAYFDSLAKEYSQFLQVSSPPQAELGPDTTACATAIYLTQANPDWSYLWTNLNEDTLSLNPGLSADSTGTYIVEATDACGLSDRDTIQVTLTVDPQQGSCVWPGDVNADGWVNIVDFLILGSIHGQMGTHRTNASADWTSQPSMDWGSQIPHLFANGVDMKHADCDGDGIVNISQDAKLIFQHAQGTFPQQIASASAGLSLRIRPRQAIVSVGDTMTYDVSLYDDSLGTVQHAYGLAFSMEHNLALSQPPILNSQDSWLGTTGADLEEGHLKYGKVMDIGLTRIDQATKIRFRQSNRSKCSPGSRGHRHLQICQSCLFYHQLPTIVWYWIPEVYNNP